MTRRSLLAMLAAAATDPERLVWQPGRKLISIPQLLTVIPPCPLLVTANFRDDNASAEVLNALLRYKWRNEPDFRDEMTRRIDASARAHVWQPRESMYDISRDVLQTLRAETRVTVGRGYWQGLERDMLR